MDIPSSSENLSEQEKNQARLFTFEQGVKRFFPDYFPVDKEAWLTYDRKEDKKDRGQILTFFTEQGEDPKKDPHMMLIFRPKGFVINYYNAPELSDVPSSSTRIRNRNTSVYGPHDQRWQDTQLEFALEKTRIHREGIDPQSPAFLSQYVGWSGGEQGNFFTMGEYIDAVSEMKAKQKTPNKKLFTDFSIASKTLWNIYEDDPEKAKELAIRRITQNTVPVSPDEEPLYRTAMGIGVPLSSLLREIEQDTPLGQKAVEREMYRMEAEEKLLKDYHLL